MLPSGFRNLFCPIHGPDTSLPGILLLNFVHLIKQVVWPISLKIIKSYVIWADNAALLSVNTIKTYLSALSQLQNLTGFGKGEFVSDSWVRFD